MERSATIGNLAAALSKFQSSVPKIPKSKTAKIPTKSGGSYEYKYADLADMLEVVAPKLAENELAITTNICTHDGHYISVSALLMHSSDEWIESDPILMPCDTTAQSIGSAITYGRRYATAAVLGVAPDDDIDGAGAETDNKPSLLITKAQAKCIGTLAKKLGWDEAKTLQAIKAKYGADATIERLTKDQASHIIAGLTAAAEKEEANDA